MITTDYTPAETGDASWLVALDIDGTTLQADGSVSDAVVEQVRRLDTAGHQVMLATGRSAAATVPSLVMAIPTPPVSTGSLDLAHVVPTRPLTGLLPDKPTLHS